MTSTFADTARSTTFRRGRRRATLPAIAVALVGLSTLTTAGGANATEFNLPDGPGRQLVYAKCRTCHDLQYVVDGKGLTADAWDGLLSDMEEFGVELSPEEHDKIQTYLSVYMGDTPPPAPETQSADTTPGDGAQVFADNCASCHQEDATGIEETFPPLAGNDDLFLAQDFPAKVLLSGMSGEVKVNGMVFDGEMPPFDYLSDADIAAVINYLRNNFGNDAAQHSDITPISADTIASIRSAPMTEEQVLAYRSSLE